MRGQNMKVLLLKDVPSLGQAGDIKEVKDGFGRNFLLARGLAKPATPKAIQESERLSWERAMKRNQEAEIFAKEAEKLKETVVVVEAKANEQGGLFRAVGKKQIETALKKIGLEAVTEGDIKIKVPIKNVGEHQAEIIHGGISGKIKIIVKAKVAKEEKGIKKK